LVWDKSQAAERPETPLPITAMRWRIGEEPEKVPGA